MFPCQNNSCHGSFLVACPLMHLSLPLSLSACIFLSPLTANFQRCRWGHSEGRALQGGERLIWRGYKRSTTFLGGYFFLQLRVFTAESAFVSIRRQTTLREPGGEPTSTWRIQSITQDGSLSTSSAKVSASMCTPEGWIQHQGTNTGHLQAWPLIFSSLNLSLLAKTARQTLV